MNSDFRTELKKNFLDACWEEFLDPSKVPFGELGDIVCRILFFDEDDYEEALLRFTSKRALRSSLPKEVRKDLMKRRAKGQRLEVNYLVKNRSDDIYLQRHLRKEGYGEAFGGELGRDPKKILKKIRTYFEGICKSARYGRDENAIKRFKFYTLLSELRSLFIKYYGSPRYGLIGALLQPYFPELKLKKRKLTADDVTYYYPVQNWHRYIEEKYRGCRIISYDGNQADYFKQYYKRYGKIPNVILLNERESNYIDKMNLRITVPVGKGKIDVPLAKLKNLTIRINNKNASPPS